MQQELILSGSPHIKSTQSTTRIMLNVIIALIPEMCIRDRQVAHCGPRPVFHGVRILKQYCKARYVGRHYVRGKLDTVAGELEYLGKGHGKCGFSHAREVLQKNVPARKQCKKYLADCDTVAHKGFADFCDDQFAEDVYKRQGPQSRSRRSAYATVSR